jgi:hypothetical protein
MPRCKTAKISRTQPIAAGNHLAGSRQLRRTLVKRTIRIPGRRVIHCSSESTGMYNRTAKEPTRYHATQSFECPSKPAIPRDAPSTFLQPRGSKA